MIFPIIHEKKQGRRERSACLLLGRLDDAMT
jgi:hypothetical protein